MAAAFIPLIASIAPSIISLITGLVHKSAPKAEAANGPATGPVNFAQVFQDVILALQQAANSGVIDKILPNDDLIKAIIQAVVTSMQMSGTLPAGSTATPPAIPATPVVPPSSVLTPASSVLTPQTVWLTSGQSLIIGVK